MTTATSPSHRLASYLAGFFGGAFVCLIIAIALNSHYSQSNYQVVLNGKSYLSLYIAVIAFFAGPFLIIIFSPNKKFAVAGLCTAIFVLLMLTIAFIVGKIKTENKSFVDPSLLVLSEESFRDGNNSRLDLSIKNNSSKTIKNASYIIHIFKDSDTINQIRVSSNAELPPRIITRTTIDVPPSFKFDEEDVSFSVSVECANTQPLRCEQQ